MSDPHLVELQGRLKRVILEHTIDEGYDRQASHREGRYVAYQVGLALNTGLLEASDALQAGFAESLAEILLNSLTLNDLEALNDLVVRRGEPILQPDERTGDHAFPDALEAVPEADGLPPGDVYAAMPDDDAIDARALEMARRQADDLGLPRPGGLDDIKLGHWRRAALRQIWRETAPAVA